MGTSAGLDQSPLGQSTSYVETYTPSLLYPIKRAVGREPMGAANVAFLGEDLWTGYEFSWLNVAGKPQVAGVRLRVSCTSEAIVESKSMKLYLGSFSGTRFETQAEVLRTLDQDLSLAFRAPVMLELLDMQQLAMNVPQMPGNCLDNLEIRTSTYERDPELLQHDGPDVVVHESLHTHLFRSVCPVTGQPDWGSIALSYSGRPIHQENLLRYLISYRNHPGFHETTVEQIYVDVLARCRPQSLTVYGRFQRRGGLDINPFRSTHETSAPVYRLPRQ